MADFLIGCTHFGHAHIIKLANRPFETVKDMDRALISNWNKAVKADDTVYHLGDFAWDTHAHYRRALNGTIIFVKGNHDQRNPWSMVDYVTLRRRKRKIVLFHYPISEWDGWYHGAVHFHCHTHDPEFQTAERRGNVTVEAIGYTPIRLETAIDRLTGDEP